MDDLTQSLLSAESDFLAALEGDTQMLASYNRTWSTLPDIVHAASMAGRVGSETLHLAHFVASRIANLASCFLDIKREEESSTTALQSDCDAMVQRMATMDLNSTQSTKTGDENCSFPNVSDARSSPPSFTPAHQWLVDNLHNPYPTASVKTQIAAASSCQVSSISSWFINARRRIGWTALCRERFSNCRADMIDAAYRALVEDNQQCPLSSELRHSFVAMKVVAEGLYPSMLTTSVLAEGVDSILKGTAEEHKKFIGARECHHFEQTKVARNPYPSPNRSITTSPLPAFNVSVMDEGEGEEDIAPQILAGSKRRRSVVEPVDQPPSTTRRATKRLRPSATPQTRLPSPPSSTDGIEVPLDAGLARLSSSHFIQFEMNNILPSHKRCFSDPDATALLKLGSMAGPRHDIVTDCFPCSDVENTFSFDDWLNTNFDPLFAMPPPAETAEPDSSALWEVELFKDYNIPENVKYPQECPSALTTDSHIPATSDLSELDSLLQSITNDTFVAASENALPFNSTGASRTVSLDSPVPDISHIDWMSLLGGPDTYQSIMGSTFSQYPVDSQSLPEIDLSVLQRPLVMTPTQPQDFTSKQAKLGQLHAMQEAVRRMEQELQFEGII